jgi:hypothetical protein
MPEGRQLRQDSSATAVSQALAAASGGNATALANALSSAYASGGGNATAISTAAAQAYNKVRNRVLQHSAAHKSSHCAALRLYRVSFVQASQLRSASWPRNSNTLPISIRTLSHTTHTGPIGHGERNC